MLRSRQVLKDKYHIVYVIFVLHGIGVTMPWNMFLNANDYLKDYKFSVNYTGPTGSYYKKHFYAVFIPATVLPLMVCLWLSVFLSANDARIDITVICSIVLEIFLFLITTILAMIDTSDWTGVFFSLTIFIVILLNLANGFHQSIIYGLAFRLSWRYAGCLVLGHNLMGTFTSAKAILARLLPISIKTEAIYYFITAMAISFLCLNTYLALPLIKYYRIRECFRLKKLQSQRRIYARRDSLTTVPFTSIFKEIFPQLLNVFLIFIVTFALFPTLQVKIRPVVRNFMVDEQTFVLVICFFTFNFFATAGSFAALFFRWPAENFVIIPVALRFLYIPFYLFCNYQVTGIERKLPVLIANDWAYWAVSATMAFTGGYWSTVTVQYIPEYVASQYRFIAGAFTVAMLITGGVVGYLSAQIWPHVI